MSGCLAVVWIMSGCLAGVCIISGCLAGVWSRVVSGVNNECLYSPGNISFIPVLQGHNKVKDEILIYKSSSVSQGLFLAIG